MSYRPSFHKLRENWTKIPRSVNGRKYRRHPTLRCNCKNGLCKWSKKKACVDSSLFIDYEEERDGILIQDVIDMGEPAEPTEPVSEIRNFESKERTDTIFRV